MCTHTRHAYRYLDHLDIAWKALYDNEPCADITSEAECKLVLGGQGEMWGETVDASDIQSTVCKMHIAHHAHHVHLCAPA